LSGGGEIAANAEIPKNEVTPRSKVSGTDDLDRQTM